MTKFDGAAFGREIVTAVREFLEREVTPLKARIAELEAHQVKYSGDYQNGKVYRPGELTSHSGSLWHCEATTVSKPGADASWKLCVKAGTFSK